MCIINKKEKESIMISCLKNANLCFKKTVQGPSALSLSYLGDPAVKVYVTTTIPLMLNPLSPNSDQHQFSFTDIHTMSRD